MGGSYDEQRQNRLLNVVSEYVFNGLVDELLEDLRIVLKEEEEAFAEKSECFARARRILCGDKV